MTKYDPMNFSVVNSNQQILVINAGSYSIKVTLFVLSDFGSTLNRIADGTLKGISGSSPVLEIVSIQGKDTHFLRKKFTVGTGIRAIIDAMRRGYGLNLSRLTAVGHRIVHGGDRYFSPTEITKSVMNDLSRFSELAPLYNDACIEGIKELMKDCGRDTLQIAIFDTAFHKNMPAVAARYALPEETVQKYHIRRYGFYGIANEYLWKRYEATCVKDKPHSKVITLHLGSGCSVTAIKDGLSMDTSMGFTPAEGLIMGTRAGDVDAGLIEFLCLRQNKSVTEVIHELNWQSGLLGISGKTGEMELLLMARDEKDEKAALAIDMFCYRIQKYIGAYITALEGVDAFIFSGGIGENSPEIRKQILDKFNWLGVTLDARENKETKNLLKGMTRKIHARESKVPVYVAGVDENGCMAEEVSKMICVNV